MPPSTNLFEGEKLPGYSVCVIVTTRCTLNCKYCLNFTPYNKDKQDFTKEEIIRNTDLFFATHSRVPHFSYSGGEPLLYPDLPELYRYVNEHYRHRIDRLWFATNGTIVPSDDICRTMVACRGQIVFSKYPESIHIAESIEKCKSFGVNHFIWDAEFFKVYPIEPENLNDSQLAHRYNACKHCYSGLGVKNGRLYACCYDMFADTAGICKSRPEDSIDLSTASSEDIRVFHSKHLTGQHVEFCKICGGFPPYNTRMEKNGVSQMP